MSYSGIEILTAAAARPIRTFLVRHRKCEGFMPGEESRARKKAGISNTYYCCYTCGERVIRDIKIEKVGK